MKDHKIIISGAVGAGKTTAVGTLSDIDVVSTDELMSEGQGEHAKLKTTVAMDYGALNLSDDERVHLYGTPGQKRFDFMWDILSEGGLGLVLLVSNESLEPFEDIRRFLDAFSDFIGETNVVIGVTKTDIHPSPTIEEYHAVLGDLVEYIPVFEVDARVHKDLVMLIEALLMSLPSD